MLPISLNFEGLNSYANRVSIDFTKFYRSRLFGIFGATGGGKSTILDAIILSIYGKTPRLSSKIDEAINPRKKGIDIEFVFEASGERFKIQRHIGEKVRTPRLYKLIGERSIPIAEKANEFQQKVHDIIGLSYEEFSKVVILPQNQFAELLRLKPADRAVLIGNLFDLNYYGEPLYNKLSEMYLKFEANLQEKERRLNELSEVSEESIFGKERELQIKEGELLKLKTNLSEKINKLNMMRNFKQLRDQKNELERELKKIEEESIEIEKLRRKIQFDDTLAPYRKLIDELRNLESSIEKDKSQLSIFEKELAEAKNKLAHKKTEKEEFDRYFSIRSEELIGKIKESEHLKEIENEIKILSERVKQRELKLIELERNLKEVEEDLKKIDKETTNSIKQIEKTEEQLRRTQLTEPEFDLFERLPRALVKISELGTLSRETERLGQLIKAEREKEESGLIRIKREFKKILNLSITKFEDIDELLLTRTRELKEQRENILQKLEELKTKNSAFLLSRTLVKGEPCPVCGSTSHPFPAQSVDESEIAKLNLDLKTLEEAIKITDEFKIKITPLVETILTSRTSVQNYENELKKKETDLMQIREELLHILDEEHWENADNLYEGLKARKNSSEELMKKISKLTLSFHEKMNRKHEISNRKIQMSSEIEKIKNELVETKTELEKKTSRLYQKTSGKTSEDIKLEAEKELKQLKLKQTQIERDLRELENRVNDITVKTEKLRETINKDSQRHEEISREIETKAKELGIETQRLSLLVLDEKTRRDIQKRIEEFEQRLNKTKGALENVINSLRQIPIEIFNEQILKDTETQVGELNEKINRLNEDIGIFKEQIRTENTLLQEKKRLEQEIVTFQRNFYNVKILRNLTHGKEMVKFFSWHLLREVVLLANQIMTTILGRRFYLKVNSNLEFNVIDLYYNNERSVNTLSGGETFIVSFALALALSSYIQRKRRRIIQFFFIDEGFSSLDRELVDSVSAVLNELKSQDRLVGFITHVDDIKQLIPNYIEVRKDITGSSTLRVNL